MRLVGLIASLVFATAVLAKEPPTELVIETTFTPEDCSVKAKTGDNLEVHYVGNTLLRLCATD